MQKKRILFLVAIVLFFGLIPSAGRNQTENSNSETIKRFSVDITVNQDSSFLVREMIVYDFGQNQKHGIYRSIPLKGLGIKVLKVVDESDNSYLFTTSRKGQDLEIKIGDPDNLITGEHTYNIFYNVKGGLGYFKNYDELYWNVTGNEWQVAIEQADTTINLPELFGASQLKFACYTGVAGSKSQDCDWTIGTVQKPYFQSKKSLAASEGLTIVLGWPKGVVAGPTLADKIFNFLKDWGGWLLPIIVFYYLFNYWRKKGRDIKLNKTIIAQYELPDNLRPAEVGLILNQKTALQDISATIIDLAVRGYLKIKEQEQKTSFFKRVGQQKDWTLIKLKDFGKDAALEDYEKFLMEKIFEGKSECSISAMKYKGYQYLRELKEKISSEVVEDNYFTADPAKIKTKLLGIGIFILIVAGVLIGTGLFIYSFINLMISLAACGLLFIIFSRFMPQKTAEGTEALWTILGFKEYIKTAERYRLKFQEKENIFEKYLPYALIFGLADKWAKAFDGIFTTPPSWYEGSYGPGTTFTTYAFVNSLSLSLTSMNNVFSPRGGGGSGGSGFSGGFSGGGGGGGGGGSW